MTVSSVSTNGVILSFLHVKLSISVTRQLDTLSYRHHGLGLVVRLCC